jgi:hypothetical protein
MKLLKGSRQLAATSLAVLVVLFLSLHWTLADTSPPLEEWSRTFGGSEDDIGYSVQQTSDGGYIIAGYTISFGAGSADVYLVKTDSQGVEEWSRTFGGSESDGVYSVQETSDGGYIIAGWTDSFGAGVSDVYLVKTDSQGREEWSRTFGGSESDGGFSVQETSDGGYIITGWTDSFSASGSDVYLVKTDSQGREEWSRTFESASNDVGRSVQETSDGGYIIAGETRSFGAGQLDVYLVKTGSQGMEEEEEETYTASIVGFEAPSEVYVGESFTVEFTVTYGFTVPTEMSPGIYDLEAETWIAEDSETLVGEGTKTYSFELTAPEEEGTWSLEASAWYKLEDEWTHDEEEYSEAFEVSVVEEEDGGGGGIPGFPYLSIAFGLIIVLLLRDRLHI